MSTLRRRKPVVAAIAAAASVLVLAGCSNGFDAGTVVTGDAAYGTTLKTDTVEVHNVLIIDAPDAEPQVIGTIVNESGTADTLIGVTVGEPPVPVQLTGVEGTTIPVPNRSLVVIAGEDGPQLNVTDVELMMGGWTPVTFHFETGGEATGDVMVLDKPVV